MSSNPRWKRRPVGSTWGDWGPDDQLGRLNLLTPDKVLQGVAEVKEGRTFCLSLPLDYPGGTVVNPRRHPPRLIANKRNFKIMAAMCILVLFGRWLDLYIVVMPFHWESPKVGPIEIAMAAGVVGLVYLIVVRALSRAPLVPPHDATLAALRAQQGGH